MRALFEVLQWGDWVDEGDSMPRYCTIGGVAKTAGPDLPYLAANEYIAAELARVVGLPAVPGVVVANKELTGFVSLRFGSKGEAPPPGIPSLLVAEQPDLAAGIVVFDCWIANADRHDRNFAYSISAKRAHLFDHDRALLGKIGVGRISSSWDKHFLEGHLLARLLRDANDLEKWIAAIQRVSERAVRLAVGEMQHAGLLTPGEEAALVAFLENRKANIRAIIHAANVAGCFPALVPGLFEP